MERLTKFVDGKYIMNTDGDLYITNGHNAIIKKLGMLEDLVEQKKILEIPYKIGDTVYDFKPFAEGSGDAEIFETLVTEICVYKDRSGRLLFVVDDGNETFYADDFGKVAFLDREEAERKLEEKKNENK